MNDLDIPDVPVLHVSEVLPERPEWYRWVLMSLLLAMVSVVLSLLVTFAVTGLGLRDRQAADSQVEALRDRALAAEARLDCHLAAGSDLAAARNNAQRAEVELLIETAEQFDLVLRDQTPSPEVLRTRIFNAREALEEAGRLASSYNQTVTQCYDQQED